MKLIEKVQEQFGVLVKVLDDYEQAHIYEDRLRETALKGIAEGKCRTLKEAREVAAIAMNTSGLDIQRYYS